MQQLREGERLMCLQILREVRVWESCSVDSKILRGELGDVGWLEIAGGERVLAAERYGGNGTNGRVGRVHGVLLRVKGDQRVDYSRKVGSDYFLP